MVYQWEWLSDLAIIPAWECFLAGFTTALIIFAVICQMTNKRK